MPVKERSEDDAVLLGNSYICFSHTRPTFTNILYNASIYADTSSCDTVSTNESKLHPKHDPCVCLPGSVIDQFMMIVMMQVFRIHVDVPSSTSLRGLFPDDFKPGEFLMVDVQITPLWGFYGFLIAALGTVAIGQMIIIAHRDTTSPGWLTTKRRPKAVEQPKALMTHAFSSVSASGARRSIRLGVATQFGMLAVFLGTLVFIIIGSTVTSFAFNIEGVAGIALDTLEPGNRRKEMSLLSTALTLSGQAGPEIGSVIGIAFIQLVFL